MNQFDTAVHQHAPKHSNTKRNNETKQTFQTKTTFSRQQRNCLSLKQRRFHKILMQGLFDAKIGTNNSRLFFHLCQALEEKSQQCALDIRHYYTGTQTRSNRKQNGRRNSTEMPIFRQFELLDNIQFSEINRKSMDALTKLV